MSEQHPLFRVQKLANYGTSEPWYARLMVGFAELIPALCLSESENEKVTGLLLEVVSEVGAAFEALQKAREMPQGPDHAISEVQNCFSDVYDHLWRAYRDRFKGFAHALGYDLGFMFKPTASVNIDDKKADKFEKQFEDGLKAFVAIRPQCFTPLAAMIRQNSHSWQMTLEEERNSDQHKGDRLQKAQLVSPRMIYNLPDAQTMFDNVWETIEEITAFLIAAKLTPPIGLMALPEAQRNPNCPVKYKLAMMLPVEKAHD